MPDYRQQAALIAQKYGIPSAIFLGLVKQESGFNPAARSPVGAIGLTQLMPQTARGLGVDPTNPMQNLAGGAKYLSDQYRKFGRWDMALAAYNAGPGAVQKYGGVPPYAETQQYVRNILANAKSVPAAPPAATVNAAKAIPMPALQATSPASARQQFALQMADTIGRSGQDRLLATMGAVMGLRRALSESNSLAQNQQLMAAVQMGAAPTGSGTVGKGGGLNTDFQQRLMQLSQAVKQAGGTLSVRSGYRSNEEQQRLWAAALKKYGSAAAARKWVAPPGHSNHNLGLAADLAGNLDLARKLAPQFGLSFPMSWEPWHIEPVGIRSK